MESHLCPAPARGRARLVVLRRPADLAGTIQSSRSTLASGHAVVRAMALASRRAAGVHCRWFLRRRVGRGSLAALLFYAGALFPLLGFMNVYGAVFSFVADRWAYLPSLGLIALAAAVVARWRWLAVGSAVALLPWLGISMAPGRVPGCIGVPELWQTTLAGNPDCWEACLGLGNERSREGRLDEAITYYRRALELRPRYNEAENNLGSALMRTQKIPEAMEHFEKALQIMPDQVPPHYNLGQCALAMGKLDDAARQFQQCIAAKPELVDARYYLGLVLGQQGKPQESLEQFRKL